MSKDKKTAADEANPHGLTEPRGGMGDLPQIPNGTAAPEAPAKRPAVKQSWSSPIQAMARIEQEMNGLDARQRGIVFAWFAAEYGERVPYPEAIEKYMKQEAGK